MKMKKHTKRKYRNNFINPFKMLKERNLRNNN